MVAVNKTNDGALSLLVEDYYRTKLGGGGRFEQAIKQARYFGQADVIVSEDSSYRLVGRDLGKSEILVVTFGQLSGGVHDVPFAHPFLTNEGHDHLHFASVEGDAYQSVSLAKFEALLQPFALRYKHVFTYGNSIGGYAALYYAGVIQAKTIAISPRLSRYPLFVGDPRNDWHQARVENNGPYLHEPMDTIPRSRFAPYIVLDDTEEIDGRFYRHVLLKVFPDAHYRLYPGKLHTLIRRLSASNKLKGLVREAIARGLAQT